MAEVVPSGLTITLPLRPAPPRSHVHTETAKSPPGTLLGASPLTPPAGRTRDPVPNHNLKRTDPYQFGTRFLSEGDDVYEFNAWDAVETDEAYRLHAKSQYEFQRAHAVSEFDKGRFNNAPEKWWDKFYTHHTTNFFKDRKWLRMEFPILEELTREPSPQIHEKVQILEVGAGAGNTAFPLLGCNKNPNLFIHACDFSPKAVGLIRSHPSYIANPSHILASVWDVASDPMSPLPEGIIENSIDVVLMIFIFSALSPEQWENAVRNVWRVLKPGGIVCLRDYGRGDLAQVRFKKGRWLGENFYVRGDGTRVYFFEEDELKDIWGGKVGRREEEHFGEESGDPEKGERHAEDQQDQKYSAITDTTPSPAFEVLKIGVDRKLLVNRKRELKMYRCWLQARFQKPLSTLESSTKMSTSQECY
ncbi:MAG: hypothetical protein MMC33_000483 [Icmadophila ericetorum]|nr:hypothetical protein [Icmadophila ericetorum]